MSEVTTERQLVYASDALISPIVPGRFPIKRLEVGGIAIIRLLVSDKCAKFFFHLLACNDIVLSITVNFNDKQITRNATSKGVWGREERTGAFNLKQGVPIVCMVLFNPASFKVAFNGKHFCDFTHRSDVSQLDISEMEVGGGVKIDHVTVQQPARVLMQANTTAMPLLQKHSSFSQGESTSGEAMSAIYSPGLPLWHYMNGGLTPGRTLYICGRPRRRSTSFVINLLVGGRGQSRENRDIALQLLVTMQVNKRGMTANTRIKNRWGAESRARSMPFVPGMHFDLIIMCEQQSYKVSVNNKHLMEYKHKILDLQHITDLQIEGQVDIIHIRSP